MTEITIALITLTAAIWAFVVARRLLHEATESVTIWDYQSGLHFKDGRYVESLAPGKHRFWGRGHRVVVYDNRISELIIQSQELLTADSATLKLTAVAQWRIADARRYHVAAEDARQALYTRIQLALRQTIGDLTLDQIIERKAGFGAELLTRVHDQAATDLGIEVAAVDIRDTMLGSELRSAYSGVLTARKEAQTKLEKARGEAAALRTLANAARLFDDHPGLLRLRALETIKEAGAGYGNQLIVGLPEEFLGLVKKG